MAEQITFEFHHIHIFCSDMTATESWLAENFGFEVAERRDSKGVPASILRLGGLMLMLRPEREGESLAPPGADRLGFDHFGLTVRDLDAAARALTQRGVLFEGPPVQWRPGLRIAFVRGPDRIRIELLEHAVRR